MSVEDWIAKRKGERGDRREQRKWGERLHPGGMGCLESGAELDGEECEEWEKNKKGLQETKDEVEALEEEGAWEFLDTEVEAMDLDPPVDEPPWYHMKGEKKVQGEAQEPAKPPPWKPQPKPPSTPPPRHGRSVRPWRNADRGVRRAARSWRRVRKEGAPAGRRGRERRW